MNKGPSKSLYLNIILNKFETTWAERVEIASTSGGNAYFAGRRQEGKP